MPLMPDAPRINSDVPESVSLGCMPPDLWARESFNNCSIAAGRL